MATVQLLTKGVKNPSTLYIRFLNGRAFDITAKTNLAVNPKHWDNSKSNYKNMVVVKNKIKLQASFDKLKISVYEQFNEAYMLGDIIDKDWLQSAVNTFFDRPKQEKSLTIKREFVYYVDFAKWWLENKSGGWKTSKNSMLNNRAVQQYNSFVKIFENFEGKQQFKIKDINGVLLDKLSTHMSDHEGYSPSTIKRHINRAKFFLHRAETESIKIDPTYNDRVFVEKEEDILKPYLNELEIDQIFNLDLSHDDALDAIRDNFIIGLWSGLRISDFNRKLDISNIDDDYISIKTTKTGASVVIPLHPQVRHVLQKRAGFLPAKSSDKHFNEKVKTICMLCDIDQMIKGKRTIVDKSGKKRGEVGMFKKFKLISSHTCRRSLCSNLYGKIPNHDLMKILGWADEKMMIHYVKKTRVENADVLKSYWNEKYK